MRLTRKYSRYYGGYYLVGRKNNCKIKIDCDDFKKEFCFYVEHLKSDNRMNSLWLRGFYKTEQEAIDGCLEYLESVNYWSDKNG